MRVSFFIQYNPKKDIRISCVSWYDEIPKEVVCICNKQGLTVNIFDKVISLKSRFNQFPKINSRICKIILLNFS